MIDCGGLQWAASPPTVHQPYAAQSVQDCNWQVSGMHVQAPPSSQTTSPAYAAAARVRCPLTQLGESSKRQRGQTAATRPHLRSAAP
jgi:hypothetical protein